MMDELEQGIPQRPQFDPEDTRHVEPARLSLKMLVFLGIVVILFNSVVTTTAVVLIRSTQVQNKPTIDNTNYLVKFIKDCTTKGGKCFQKNVEETAAELGSVDRQNRRVSAATAACGVRLSSQIATLSRHEAFLAVYTCQQAELLAKH